MIRWATDRPAIAWALAVGILGAGAVAFTKLPLATRDVAEQPRLSVSAQWPGASPEVMETWVTSPIESVVQGVHGVIGTSSTSESGSASIEVRLDPKVDIAMARLGVLERMEALRGELPQQAQQSLSVTNFVPAEEQQQPLLTVNVTGSITPGSLAQAANDLIVPAISALPGVGRVFVNGGATNGIAITFNAELMKQLGVSAAAIQSVISTSRLVEPLGVTDNGISVRPVTLRHSPLTVEDLAHLPIVGAGGRIFTVGDLATVNPEEDNHGSFYRINGRTAVTISIARLPLADAIKTAHLARATLDSLKEHLPASVALRVLTDESQGLAEQLDNLALRGAIAFGAVLLVLLLSTRNIGGSFVIIGSAGVAIGGTALGLFLLDIPANMLTLAGLAMGIGVLVQNGLVVVDRLQYARNTGPARAEAALRITPAVLGSTLTTIVVLIPFLYLQGNARTTYVPFAVAFGLALLWSIITALILVPAVSRSGVAFKPWPRLARINLVLVRTLLRWRLASQFVTLLVLLGLTWVFLKKIPRTDWGNWGSQQHRTTIRASVQFPRGSDPVQVEGLVRELEQIALHQPGAAIVVARGNPSGGGVDITFTPETSYGAEPWIASDALTQRAVVIGGTEAVSVSKPEGPGFYGGSGGSEMISKRIRILGYSYEGVRQIALDLKDRLALNPRVPLDGININVGDFRGGGGTSIVLLTPDRNALGRVGATTRDYNQSVSTELKVEGGSSYLMLGDLKLPVTIKSHGTTMRQLEELGDGALQNPDGVPMRIRDVSTIGEVKELGSIQRIDQRYIRVLGYDFRGPSKLADRRHKAFMNTVSVPPGYSVEEDTGRFGFDESAKALNMVFLLGVVLVLLSVALVYNSVWAAAMVFLSLPIALGGVVVAFWVTGTAFTREAAVGVILVVGLAVNHSILLIDAAVNQRLRHGKVTPEGIFRATLDRTEMIVLVTLTTVASLVPMSWGTDSKDTFSAIAVATAGGVLASALGAMYIFPPILLGWRALGIKRNRLRRRAAAKAKTDFPSEVEGSSPLNP